LWVLRAFLEFVIAAVLLAWRAWLALLFHPFESVRLAAMLPLNLLWRAPRLIHGLMHSGVAIQTPEAGSPALRTAVIGFGEVTTLVVSGSSLTKDLVSLHFEAVRARLAPVSEVLDGLVRGSALVVAALTVYFNRATFTGTSPWWSEILTAFARAYAVSFVFAILGQSLAKLCAVGVRWWLDCVGGSRSKQQP
jgi:hypothetical protein